MVGMHVEEVFYYIQGKNEKGGKEHGTYAVTILLIGVLPEVSSL